MARTKIVATIGPASNSPEMIDALFCAGVDVFRLNMSHGDHAGHAKVVRAIRECSARAKRPVGILCDLSGPKIRLGNITDGPVTLASGDKITLTTEPVEGNAQRVWVNYPELPHEVEAGQHVLLDDGLLEFEVLGANQTDVQCLVVRGGPLSSHKGVNLPDTPLSIPSLTEKDLADIEFGLANDVDFFAMSFVRRPEDVDRARQAIEERGGNLPLIAKIEMAEAVKHLEEIVRRADGCMVARGDLGVEIPLEEVPLVQKRLIELCNKAAKPVITATQMLDSMIRSPRPTRAEVTDIANAILDGSDAVMLSGETAVGQFPLEAVKMMERVALATEPLLNHKKWLDRKQRGPDFSVADSISHVTAEVAEDLQVNHILCLSQGGTTPRAVARYRPRSGVLVCTPLPRTAQQLCLTWGVQALVDDGHSCRNTERPDGLELEISECICVFKDHGIVFPGEQIVVTAGLPLRVPGTTNMLRVVEAE